MADIARRRKYPHNRVLIESSRVLNPSFDPAVVYLTGSQVELLRNVTQYLRKPETYVATYTPGYYLIPTLADFDAVLAIVADLEEILMGNPNTVWGYQAQWLERIAEVSIGDPNTYAVTATVPAGYIHIAENIHCYHTDGGTCAVGLTVRVGGANPILYQVPALPSDENVIIPCNVTLKEGQYLEWRVTALAATELAVLRVLGYKMKVPE